MRQDYESNKRSATGDYTVRTLEEVADILNLSRQRVHDIEKRALNKLRYAFAEQFPLLRLVRNERGYVCGLEEMECDSVGCQLICQPGANTPYPIQGFPVYDEGN